MIRQSQGCVVVRQVNDAVEPDEMESRVQCGSVEPGKVRDLVEPEGREHSAEPVDSQNFPTYNCTVSSSPSSSSIPSMWSRRIK